MKFICEANSMFFFLFGDVVLPEILVRCSCAVDFILFNFLLLLHAVMYYIALAWCSDIFPFLLSYHLSVCRILFVFINSVSFYGTKNRNNFHSHFFLAVFHAWYHPIALLPFIMYQLLLYMSFINIFFHPFFCFAVTYAKDC